MNIVPKKSSVEYLRLLKRRRREDAIQAFTQQLTLFHSLGSSVSTIQLYGILLWLAPTCTLARTWLICADEWSPQIFCCKFDDKTMFWQWRIENPSSWPQNDKTWLIHHTESLWTKRVLQRIVCECTRRRGTFDTQVSLISASSFRVKRKNRSFFWYRHWTSWFTTGFLGVWPHFPGKTMYILEVAGFCRVLHRRAKSRLAPRQVVLSLCLCNYC